MDQTLTDVPRLRRPAVVNAAQYWLAPEQFARRCQRLGDRFLVPMPATGPWLCLTDPEDIKRVFTADTDVLRLGAALAKASAHHLFLGPTGLTNLDGAEHMRKRRMQLPPFHGQALTGYHETMERKTEEALARWPYGRRTPSQPHMDVITPRGDHGHRVRGHRPRARRAVARGDARAASRGPLAPVLRPDDHRDQP